MDSLAIFGFGDVGWGWQFVAGLSVTLQVALLALPLGLSVGLAIALTSQSGNRLVRGFASGYTTVFRGTPEILTLFAIYHGGSQLVSTIGRELGFTTGFVLPGVLAGALALGLVFSAYAAEVWRGAIAAVGDGQKEAALSLGLRSHTAFRLVVLPQAFRIAVPGLGNLWLILLKDTALVSIIAVADFMRQVNLAVQSTREPFALYLFACLVYVVLTLISVKALRRLEHRAAIPAGR
ncbi:MAG: ABC transporter permease subunit [Pseudomonadota bacterium]